MGHLPCGPRKFLQSNLTIDRNIVECFLTSVRVRALSLGIFEECTEWKSLWDNQRGKFVGRRTRKHAGPLWTIDILSVVLSIASQCCLGHLIFLFVLYFVFHVPLIPIRDRVISIGEKSMRFFHMVSGSPHQLPYRLRDLHPRKRHDC